MSYLFDQYAGIYDSFMQLFSLNHTQIIENQLPPTRLSILDIGGGSGFLASKLQKKGHHVILLDASEAMLKQAYKRNPQLTLIHSPLNEHMSIEKVDIIICRDCLHHLTNQKDAIRIMMTYLKDEGKLLIYDFNPFSYRIRLLFLFERCCKEKITPVSLQLLKRYCEPYHFKCLYKGKWDYLCEIRK